ALAIAQSTPQIDHQLALVINGHCRAELAMLGEILFESRADGFEVAAAKAVDFGHALSLQLEKTSRCMRWVIAASCVCSLPQLIRSNLSAGVMRAASLGSSAALVLH